MNSDNAKPKQQLSLRRWKLNIGVALFFSFWVSSIGLAVFPSVAHPVISIIWGSSETKSDRYSYKPGQSGVERHFYYLNEDKKPVPIHTFWVFLLTLVFYTVVFFVLVNILIYASNKKMERKERLNE